MGRPKGSRNKSVKGFCKRGHALDYRKTWKERYCKPCTVFRANRWIKLNPERRKEICRDWYWNSPKEYRDNLKKIARDERAELRAWINGIKLKSGCVDCGYRKHAEALDFDHLRDKKHDVAGMCNWRAPKESILKEIAKCEVVCSNCHRHRTKMRRVNGLSG